jgi:hypothetical protein
MQAESRPLLNFLKTKGGATSIVANATKAFQRTHDPGFEKQG